MTGTTRFVSKLFGLYCLIVGGYMLGHRDAMVGLVTALVHDPPVMFTLGVLTLLGGLAMILIHNVWSSGAPALIVTLLGWLAALKGLSFLFLATQAAADFYLGTLRYGEMFYAYTSVTLLLGAYLTYIGFRLRP